MDLFKELKTKIETTTNSNFYFNKMDSTTGVWIRELCKIVDDRIAPTAPPRCEKCKNWNDQAVRANFCYNCGRPLRR